MPQPLKVIETPGQGLIHPLSPEIFSSPRKYLQWYLAKAQEDPAHAMAPPQAPRVAVLLYRKHYITNQLYIAQLIRMFEREGLLPVPIFINGVEGVSGVRASACLWCSVVGLDLFHPPTTYTSPTTGQRRRPF